MEDVRLNTRMGMGFCQTCDPVYGYCFWYAGEGETPLDLPNFNVDEPGQEWYVQQTNGTDYEILGPQSVKLTGDDLWCLPRHGMRFVKRLVFYATFSNPQALGFGGVGISLQQMFWSSFGGGAPDRKFPEFLRVNYQAGNVTSAFIDQRGGDDVDFNYNWGDEIKCIWEHGSCPLLPDDEVGDHVINFILEVAGQEILRIDDISIFQNNKNWMPCIGGVGIGSDGQGANGSPAEITISGLRYEREWFDRQDIDYEWKLVQSNGYFSIDSPSTVSFDNPDGDNFAGQKCCPHVFIELDETEHGCWYEVLVKIDSEGTSLDQSGRWIHLVDKDYSAEIVYASPVVIIPPNRGFDIFQDHRRLYVRATGSKKKLWLSVNGGHSANFTCEVIHARKVGCPDDCDSSGGSNSSIVLSGGGGPVSSVAPSPTSGFPEN